MNALFGVQAVGDFIQLCGVFFKSTLFLIVDFLAQLLFKVILFFMRISECL